MRGIPQKEGGARLILETLHCQSRACEDPPNKTGLRARKPGGPSPRCHGEEDLQKSGRFSDRMEVTIERGDEEGNEGNPSFSRGSYRSVRRSRSFAASASTRNGFAR